MVTQAILNILRSDASIVINKSLAKKIGLNEAIIYSELISKYLYFENRKMLVQLEISKDRKTKEITYSEELFFYCSSNDLEDSTTLSYKKQLKSIAKLCDLQLINCIVKKNHTGNTVRYFTINLDSNIIIPLLSDNVTTKIENSNKNTVQTFGNHGKFQNGISGSDKMEFPEVPKWHTNNTNINNTNLIIKDNDIQPESHTESEKKETKVSNHDHPKLPVRSSCEKDHKETIDKFVDRFNELVCADKKVKLVTKSRKNKLVNIINQLDNDTLFSVFDAIQNSEYLRDNLDFSYLIKDIDTFVATCENKYKTRGNVGVKSKNNVFTNTYNHDFDISNLEQKELDKLNREYGQSNNRQYVEGSAKDKQQQKEVTESQEPKDKILTNLTKVDIDALCDIENTW